MNRCAAWYRISERDWQCLQSHFPEWSLTRKRRRTRVVTSFCVGSALHCSTLPRLCEGNAEILRFGHLADRFCYLAAHHSPQVAARPASRFMYSIARLFPKGSRRQAAFRQYARRSVREKAILPDCLGVVALPFCRSGRFCTRRLGTRYKCFRFSGAHYTS